MSPDGRSADGNWYVLLYGVPAPSAPMVLAPGLSLRPLAEEVSVFDLAAAGASGLREWAILEPLARSCRCEIESALDGAHMPGYDALNRAWLATGLLMLRGYSTALGVACSAYSWTKVAGHTTRLPPLDPELLVKTGVAATISDPLRQLPPFKGSVLDYHRKLFVPVAPRPDPPTLEDVEWIGECYESFNKLAAEDTRFRLALESAVDWRYTPEPRAAVARLWTGIEALFGISSELVFRLSLLCACVLESRGRPRRERFAHVKRLYGLRSKLVHGEVLAGAKVEQSLCGSFDLLRDLLVTAIERGHVLTQEDFDSALFD